MNRREFTKNICSLILDMVNAGEQPILDWVKRSREEQRRMYIDGLSQCDGEIKMSYHQYGKAADIYLVTDEPEGNIKIWFDWDEEKAKYWHDIWETKYGGKPMIKWDLCHFEN